MSISAQASGRRRRQRGAIAIVVLLMLGGMIGFVGFALDLSRVYNRRAELQTVANVAALAAARQLNGTSLGLDNALAQAGNAVNALRFQYNHRVVNWNDEALSFGTAPGGPWMTAASAKDAPLGALYVRADTAGLGAAIGTLDLVFMRVVSASLGSTRIAVKAVAGRSTIDVTPLAVCALSNTAFAPRANPGPPANVELVEYGFRRGVVYDLMQLNPDAVTAENFVIDPFSPPGTPGAAANTDSAFVGPYVCTGQLGMPRVFGGAITVGRPFPLGLLYRQLNSRFDDSGGRCSSATAPPDTNIRAYSFNTEVTWMAVKPDRQGAQSSNVGGKLWTVADPVPVPATNTAMLYGPLWTYAKAVPFSSYVPGGAESATGYTAFVPTAWPTLYPSATPPTPVAKSSYPGNGSTPYKAGLNALAPTSAPGLANRRVLNVALLSCPVGTGATTAATVLGIGKFLMTVPATDTVLFAEFGGLAPETSLAGAVELYP